MSVAIVIATYGDYEWRRHGAELRDRTEDQQGVETIHFHGTSLSQARNYGAAQTDAEWLVFLDADDRLEDGYVEAMNNGTEAMRQPATRGFYPSGEQDDEAVLIPERNLMQANFLVIGTMVNRSLFDEVGGFRELPILEDWDLFIRMWLAGGEYEPIEDAVYWVYVRENSRNLQQNLHTRVYNEIKRTYRGLTRRINDEDRLPWEL